MARFNSKRRHTVLSVVFAALIVTAGCSSMLTDDSGPTPGPNQSNQQGTATPANESSGTAGMPANGTDLRSVSLPENESEVNVYSGEIDGGDSILEGTNQYYEEIVFAAEAGDRIAVGMAAGSGDTEIRLRNPNGTTIAIADNTSLNDSNNSSVTNLTLTQTGQYTILAAAAEPNTSFEYQLAIRHHPETTEEDEENFQGEPSEWDERSRYLDFIEGASRIAADNAGGQDAANWSDYEPETAEEMEGNLSVRNYSVNTEEDYVVMSYYMHENETTDQMVDVYWALLNSYWGGYNFYTNESNRGNASWVPDRIYHVGYTFDDEVYRTSFIERDWLVEYHENSAISNESAANDYFALFPQTVRSGPAHPNYDPDGLFSVEPRGNETTEEYVTGLYEDDSDTDSDSDSN